MHKIFTFDIINIAVVKLLLASKTSWGNINVSFETIIQHSKIILQIFRLLYVSKHLIYISIILQF